MIHHITAIAIALVLSQPLLAGDPETTARKSAGAAFKASGGENWAKVKAIRFTFNVGQGDKVLASATHHWQVRAGTDTVSWGGKTVTINIWNPSNESDAKTAYARWVNDSYWLLMPLKLCDKGVTLTYKGQQDVEGKTYDVLHLGFASVGLTPGDQYNIYVDPDTHLVRRWDYMPNSENKISGTWDGYKMFGGLNLSTEHTFGDKRIWFSDVAVELD